MSRRPTRHSPPPAQPPPAAEIAPSGKPFQTRELASCPPPERWHDWTELDAKAWPKRVERHYTLVPTICFNCEAACGLLAYIDQQTGQIQKLEGNPYHPASRGRNCAKGPATINQIHDDNRILYPMKRTGPRGEGGWERITWDQALDEIAAQVRAAIVEDRRDEIMYHVGRPGHDGTMERVLGAWGVDAHNSHTNVCSSSARFGYEIWMGIDRPSPDHANAQFILLISAHLETGHYFNPQAQRIIEGKMKGAKLAVMDPRLSNTASMADYWLPTQPGSEAAVLLAMAKVLLDEDLFDHEYVRRWVNWQEYLRAEHPDVPQTFDQFIAVLRAHYAAYTPAFAEAESGVPAAQIVEIARLIGRAGSRFASHTWRAASAGNLGGWQVSRALWFLQVLTGSVGTPGGTAPNTWNKFVPKMPLEPTTRPNVWNELLYPPEYPLAHFELSILLPHFLKEGRGKVAAYFTRVYNPVWTNPDGASWVEMLTNEQQIELHAALTPTWSETAWYADYVLPMGHAPERHDLMSQETHAGRWIAFRQPVLRVARERAGETITFTYEANPGEVWEEDEFWIELSWRIDPDGRLGIRRYFESPDTPGQKLTVTEYYRWIFEHSVPGLPEAAQAEGLSPLDYMRKYGAFAIPEERVPVFQLNERPVAEAHLADAVTDPLTGVVRQGDTPVGVLVDGVAREGFPTPSRKLELYSPTLAEWGWPEYMLPSYIRSHVHPANLNRDAGEYVLVPTFRLPTLIHTRSGNAKWLYEISNVNPVWVHPEDAARIGIATGDHIKIATAIGWFIDVAWVTDGIRPGVVACSHHLGRWRVTRDAGTDRWASALVDFRQVAPGQWRMRRVEDVQPFTSTDPDSERIFWREGGVHQNLTFPVHPDPISGMHCWHQQVTITLPEPGEEYGDIFVDTNRAHEVYREWLAQTRPQPRADGLRRPLWLARPYRPATAAFYRAAPPAVETPLPHDPQPERQ
jgi:anaerobic selenocysteine-containing dehydrogenase